MRSGTELAREIQLTDWSTAGNLSNRSSGVQIPRDICTRFGRYLYSTKFSWIINCGKILRTFANTREILYFRLNFPQMPIVFFFPCNTRLRLFCLLFFITVFREEATSALAGAGFHAGPVSWSNWNLEC